MRIHTHKEVHDAKMARVLGRTCSVRNFYKYVRMWRTCTHKSECTQTHRQNRRETSNHCGEHVIIQDGRCDDNWYDDHHGGHAEALGTALPVVEYISA